jgi:DNA-binding MarR family transcriptional regulator
MEKTRIIEVRKVSQQHAYASLQFHETISRKAGFAATDHKYLGFFLQRGNLTAGQLADLTGLTTGAVTGLIDRFEKKKLVKRQFDKSDRRKVIIVPDTKKIAALFEPFYKKFQTETENLLASFSEKELTIIQSYMTKAIALMKQTKDKFNQPKG